MTPFLIPQHIYRCGYKNFIWPKKHLATKTVITTRLNKNPTTSDFSKLPNNTFKSQNHFLIPGNIEKTEMIKIKMKQ